MTVEYSQDKLCEHIAGGKSLVSWCHDNGVGYSTVMAHLAKDVSFQEKYACAREHAADFHVDEVIMIADTEEDPARARVRVDARKWVAAKMKPKKYGDSAQLKLADADGNKLPISSILGALDGRSAGLPGTEEPAE